MPYINHSKMWPHVKTSEYLQLWCVYGAVPFLCPAGGPPPDWGGVSSVPCPQGGQHLQEWWIHSSKGMTENGGKKRENLSSNKTNPITCFNLQVPYSNWLLSLVKNILPIALMHTFAAINNCMFTYLNLYSVLFPHW